jgi:hypothetical protein
MSAETSFAENDFTLKHALEAHMREAAACACITDPARPPAEQES